MGQSLVIMVAAATLTLGILLFATQRNTTDADVAVADYHYKSLAREAASTGVNVTVRKLIENPTNWQATPTAYESTDVRYHSGEFTVTVAAIDPDTVDIVSTGTDFEGIHVIEARYAQGYTTIAVPPSFKYAIISDEDLTLNGQASIETIDSTNNSNIHANGDLTTNGSKVHVEGTGTYGDNGSATVNPEKAIDEIFVPNDDPNGGDQNVYQFEDVEIPVLDPTLYDEYTDASSPDSITAGDLTIASGSDFASLFGLGTGEDPYLLYVNGNLTINGPVTMPGYIQIVTYGSITIFDAVTVTPPPANNDPQAVWDAWELNQLDAEGNVPISYNANGDITINGGSTVVGQLFSNQTVVFNGGGGGATNLIGGVTSSNTDINVNGGLVIRYAEISEKVVIPGFTKIVPEGVRLINWAEW